MSQQIISAHGDISPDKQVAIICSGRKYIADRDVICAGSPYFSAMFKSGMKEALTNKVAVEDMDAEALKVVLRFLHTGKIDENDEDSKEEKLKPLFLAAHLLQVEAVQSFAAFALGKTTNKDNLDELRQFAATYNSNEVLEGVLRFLAQNLINFEDNIIFLELNEDELAFLLDVTRELTLSPENSLKSILKWVKHKTEERCQFLIGMIGRLRLSSLSRQFIQFTIASDSLFREHMDVSKAFMMTVLIHRIIDQVQEF